MQSRLPTITFARIRIKVQNKLAIHIVGNYIVIMKAKIIKIGNSKGIRIPKPILEQTGMPNEVDVQVEGDMIILKPARKIREGWKKAFQKMTEHGDDRLLDKESVNQPGEWEKSEWEW